MVLHRTFWHRWAPEGITATGDIPEKRRRLEILGEDKLLSMGDEHSSSASANHHYVPKLYLKGFADNGILWVHEKGKAPRKSKPKDEAHRDNYYSHSDRGYVDDSVEKMLGKAESLVAPVIRKLANPQFRMSPIQRSELYMFIAMMFVRVPAYREFLDLLAARFMKAHSQEEARNADKFYASMKRFESDTGESVGDYEKLREFLLSEAYTVSQNSAGYNLRMALESSLTVSAVLETEYKYDVLYAPADLFFMTCDNPVMTLQPGAGEMAFMGGGIGRPDTQVLFPLNKRACLRLHRRGRNGQEAVKESRTKQINDVVMAYAQQYLYAPRGYRRISRMFQERGCKVKYGENALM
jgi:hypothetical protein